MDYRYKTKAKVGRKNTGGFNHQLRVYSDITQLIASLENPTPLVMVNRINPNGDFQIYLKLERYNPFGPVKDRLKQAPIISLNIEGYEHGEAGAILDQAFDIKVRAGLHCAPAVHKTLGTYPLGTIRLSPGYFNTVEEIDLALHALEKIARTKLPKGCRKLENGERVAV